MTPARARLLIVATTMIGVIFGTASAAQAAWREVTHYPDLGTCEQAGRDGVASGEWDLYYCHYVWGDWLLWAHYPD